MFLLRSGALAAPAAARVVRVADDVQAGLLEAPESGSRPAGLAAGGFEGLTGSLALLAGLRALGRRGSQRVVCPRQILLESSDPLLGVCPPSLGFLGGPLGRREVVIRPLDIGIGVLEGLSRRGDLLVLGGRTLLCVGGRRGPVPGDRR